MDQNNDRDFRAYVLEDTWKILFYNRERIPQECDLFDSINGVYPNEDRWDTDIVLNLNAEVDENGRVKEITYYKIKDYTSGHGRPVTEDRPLSASDIKRFTEILSTYTIPRAVDIIEPLLQTAKQKGLPNGWKITKTGSSSVVFQSAEGLTVSIPKKQIIKILEVSYTYIDVLYNPEFWDANVSVFKTEYRDPLLALFSYVDTSDYYQRDNLIEEANRRSHFTEHLNGYFQLCRAVESHDYASIGKYISYIERPGDVLFGVYPPLYVALKCSDKKAVKTLLAHGAQVSEVFYEENVAKNTTLSGAVESPDASMLRLCLKEDPSPEALEIAMKTAQRLGKLNCIIELLKKGATIDPGPEFDKLDNDVLLDLVKYKTVKWRVNEISRVYSLGNTAAVKRMLKSIQYESDPIVRNERFDYSYYEVNANQSSIVRWIVSVGDESLIRFCSRLKYSIGIDVYATWMELVQLPASWAKPIKQICLNKADYKYNVQKAIQTAIKQRDISVAQTLISFYDARIDPKCVHFASTSRYNWEQWKPVNDQTIAFVINNWQFPSEYQNGKNEKTWDRESDFPWLFEAVIGSGNKQLCALLFEKLPEVLNCPKYVEKIKYYCGRRSDGDDAKEYIVKHFLLSSDEV